jgi:hypothetical protein
LKLDGALFLILANNIKRNDKHAISYGKQIATVPFTTLVRIHSADGSYFTRLVS